MMAERVILILLAMDLIEILIFAFQREIDLISFDEP